MVRVRLLSVGVLACVGLLVPTTAGVAQAQEPAPAPTPQPEPKPVTNCYPLGCVLPINVGPFGPFMFEFPNGIFGPPRP